jgi:hypothetical protein
MVKRNLVLFLTLLLVLDILYSFIQHFHTHLDGDMASFILQTEAWKKVLNDPFGFNVLFNNQSYPDPNRFFSHWSISIYFKSVPFIFQKFVSPIDSIYLSCAFIKIIIQVVMIYLLASLICGKKKFDSELIISALLITPLFQTKGYSNYMGIIDNSISYFFFYALPFCFLLLFYYIIINKQKQDGKYNAITRCFLIILSIMLPFSGPLIAGIAIIISPIFFFYYISINHKRLSQYSFINTLKFSINSNTRYFTFILLMITCVSLYSLFIGMSNSINYDNVTSLVERYSRLPVGLYNIFTQKLGLPLLMIITLVNFIIIKKINLVEKKQIFALLNLTGIFSLIYILLLPFGGYRFYRPNVLRFDTFMPITFALIFLFGISSYHILRRSSFRLKRYYVVIIIGILLLFTIADKPDFKDYNCERASIEQISHSPEKIVRLDANCNIMSWGLVKDAEDSKINAELLYYFKVTKEIKLYFQR